MLKKEDTICPVRNRILLGFRTIRIHGFTMTDNSIHALVCSTPTSFLPMMVYWLKIGFWWQPIAPILGCHYLER